MAERNLIERFRRARKDEELVVLEGFHAIKHACRFGADFVEVVTADADGLAVLIDSFAPDIGNALRGIVERISRDRFEKLAPVTPATGILAMARRPSVSLERLLASDSPAPLVILENPRHLGNIGAAVRVAAAAGAAGLMTIGDRDPLSPPAIRGGAGLQFAIPVVGVRRLPQMTRPIIALHPEGEPFDGDSVPSGAALAFGSERHGLTADLLDAADAVLRIPMMPGVSSLNLATAVATALYITRLCGSDRFPDRPFDSDSGVAR